MGNPMDWFLLQLSRFFPFDYLALAVVVFYLLASAVYAMTSLGVRFLVIVMYPLRAKKSYPQALLLCTANVIFISFAISCQLAWVAPQYTSFGLQTYKGTDGSLVPCTLLMSTTHDGPSSTAPKTPPKTVSKGHSKNVEGLSKHSIHTHLAGWKDLASKKGDLKHLIFLDLSLDPHSKEKIPLQSTSGKAPEVKRSLCRPTQISMIVNGIMARYPIFGTIFQHTSVGFVFVFFLFSLVSLARNPKSKWVPDSDDEEDSDEDEETIAFLGGSRDDAGMFAIEDEFM